MKIGIDLDGVIFDSEKGYRVYSELYDIIDLNKNSKIDNREVAFEKRFNWSEGEIKGFIKKYHKKIVTESNFMPGAKEVLKMLKNEGNSLILITARGCANREMIGITEDIFKENGMEIFDKYYWATEIKDEVCKKENVDIMIYYSYEKCKRISKANIKTIYLKDAPSYDMEENEYLKVLYNWGEIYRYINELNKNNTL